MVKRGQVSLFIILALVIIGGGLIVYFLNSQSRDIKKNDITSLSEGEKKVYNEIESCLKEKAYDSLDEIGKNGGYFNLPKQVNYAGVPYYLFEDESLYPDLNSIEDQISLFMKENTKICLYMINTSDFDIKSKGNIDSKVIIEQEQVHFKITYPISLTENNYTSMFDKFDFFIPIKLGKIYNASLEFLENDARGSEGLCLTCLKNIGRKNSLEFSGSDYGNGDFVIHVRDNDNSNERGAYLFRFALKYKLI